MKGFLFMKCLRCDYPQMKSWAELTDEEKFLAERLPLSAEFTRQERETHLFCPRCWHEETGKPSAVC